MPANGTNPRGPVGIIGLGLMGRDIAACLLAKGFDVVAFNRTPKRAQESIPHIGNTLAEMARRKLVSKSMARRWNSHFRVASSLSDFKSCRLVIESVKEDLALKSRIFDELEQVVPARTVIASNTSSIPITVLQTGRRRPERFIGMHWGEPAQIMLYLEIIPGRHTSSSVVRRTLEFGESCGKEPTILNQDIRGFLSNRLMYAMLREACYLVELGVADVETIDRSFRNDMGWWATLAGPFRWMDLTGIPAYATVMEGLLPELCASKTVPKLMRDMVGKGGRGISNQKGFYRYTKHSARKWGEAWVEFTYDVKKLAEKYRAVGS